MEGSISNNLALSERAALIRQNGQLLEAQDYYSFFILIYLINKEHVRLLYDFTGELVNIEYDENVDEDDFITAQLASKME